METILGVIGTIAIAILLIKVFGKSSSKAYLDTKGRQRCGRCEKISYRDGPNAQRAADNAGRNGTYLHAYYERRCGNWHLTSQGPRFPRF